MKIEEVVRRIEAYHPYLEGYDGCDGIKAGDPGRECTGVACALVPTYGVVKRAIEAGCNFLYVHEPTYYMTPDYPEWRGDFPNEVYECKRRLIDENQLTIYRDHDHTHAHQPDGIFTGVIRYLGWEDYLLPPEEAVPFGYSFELPEMTVAQINDHLIRKIGMKGSRYIGRPTDKIHRVGIVGHLYPGGFGETKEENGFYTDYSTEIIRFMETRGLQGIIPGEIIEWNVLSYIRDAVDMGKAMACFNIGHFNFEELGARYAADWIGELCQGEVSVMYLPTGDLWSFA